LAVGEEVPAGFIGFLNQAAENPEPLRQFFTALATRLLFYQTQQVFIQQTMAQRSIIRQWAARTGASADLPVFTERDVAQAPLLHAMAITQDLQAIASEALRLHEQAQAGRPFNA
jgi:hypothetical protein